MASNPAVLITDDLIEVLEKEALHACPFLDLTGTQNPWEVDYKNIRNIRKKLNDAEYGVRQAYEGKEVTCILSGSGAFWMPQGGLETFLEKLDIPLKQLKIEGPTPVWKLTSAEIFSSHISNMRQMIMAASHDLILLEQLKANLGTNHDFLHREFEQCERSLRILLDEIKNQGPSIKHAMTQSAMLYERARITRTLIENGEASPEDLGYTIEDLEKAAQYLEEKCRRELPAFQQRITAANNQLTDSLRGGEHTQLTRASRWDMAFSMLGPELPPGYGGQSMVSDKERDGMQSVVASREEELGESEEGKSALKVAQEVTQMKETPPPETKAPEPEPEPAPVPTPKQKDIRRMARTSRRR